MADAKIDMALDEIIKKNRNGPRNQRGRGGNNVQRRRGNNQRGNRGGRIGKSNNNNGNRNSGNFRRGTGRNTFGQRNTIKNRSNNFRQQRGKRNTISGYNRGNFAGDKPTATYNPLSRDVNSSGSKQQQQQPQQQQQTSPRKPQGSVFNKIRTNQNVTALRRRMVAAQRALTRATRTLAALPKMKQQRQRFLQQPQKLRNIITRNRLAGNGIRKRLNTGRKQIGRGGPRRMFV